jgi:hypothetical protein
LRVLRGPYEPFDQLFGVVGAIEVGGDQALAEGDHRTGVTGRVGLDDDLRHVRSV